MEITWDNKKNELLKKVKGVSFEQVVAAIDMDEIMDFLKHPNEAKYPEQVIILVNINDYVYAVPAVRGKDMIFLKTIYPSRKYTKKYLNK